MVLCRSLLETCVQSLKLIFKAVFVLELVMCSPPRNVSLGKFLKSWKLQYQIPFKHIFWSNYHLSNFFWKFWRQTNLLSSEKVNICSPSGYFPFVLHFSFWNKQTRNLQQQKTGKRWKIVKPITSRRNFLKVTWNRVSHHYAKNVMKVLQKIAVLWMLMPSKMLY